jgi:large subunit ribosomal protein L29
MKASAIKELSLEELRKQIESETASLIKMRMNHAISPLENPLTMRHARRLVARLQTELTHRNASN